ncbi:MAG: Yip1 family protein [Chloroflexota bacterium]
MQPVNQQDSQSIIDRFIGVIKLDPFTFQSIKRDPAATSQAWIIVLLAGLISGIATARQLAQISIDFQQSLDQASRENPDLAAQISTMQLQSLDTSGGRLATIVFSVLGLIIAWWLFAALARWAGRQFFGADPDATSAEEMRRLTGWAYAPSLLQILAPVPVIGPIIAFFAGIWTLVVTVYAVRNGLNLTTGKSIGASIVAWILPGILIGLLVCGCVGIVAATGGITPTTGATPIP